MLLALGIITGGAFRVPRVSSAQRNSRVESAKKVTRGPVKVSGWWATPLVLEKHDCRKGMGRVARA